MKLLPQPYLIYFILQLIRSEQHLWNYIKALITIHSHNNVKFVELWKCQNTNYAQQQEVEAVGGGGVELICSSYTFLNSHWFTHTFSTSLNIICQDQLCDMHLMLMNLKWCYRMQLSICLQVECTSKNSVGCNFLKDQSIESGCRILWRTIQLHAHIRTTKRKHTANNRFTV